jgi:hypothetical protein
MARIFQWDDEHPISADCPLAIQMYSLENSEFRTVSVDATNAQRTIIARKFPARRLPSSPQFEIEKFNFPHSFAKLLSRKLQRLQFWDMVKFCSPKPYSDGVFYRFSAFHPTSGVHQVDMVNPDDCAPASTRALARLGESLMYCHRSAFSFHVWTAALCG